MPRVLKDITISEVSSVDRGAGRGVKVMLMKREDADALPDGSFLIKNATDLKNAIQTVGRATDLAKAKAHITSRAKTLGLTDQLPDTWKRDDTGESEMTKEEIDKLVSDAVTVGIKKALEEPTKLIEKQADDIVLLKMTDAHKTYMASCDGDTQKKFKAMSPDERDAFAQKNPVKKAADTVDQSELAKRDTEIADLKKGQAAMATELAANRLEKAQADFRKKAVDAGLAEADGETMRKAYGGDAEAQALLTKRHKEVTDGLKKQVDTAKLFGNFGSDKGAQGDAYVALMAKAEELLKTAAGKDLTKEQAFEKVYTDPANAELKAQYKTEDMRKRLSVVAA